MTGRRYAQQASFGGLFPVGIAPDQHIACVSPSSPAVYCIVDPETLGYEEHHFRDSLNLDWAGLLPSLDADGVSYNSEWGSSDARRTRGHAAVCDALLGGRVAR